MKVPVVAERVSQKVHAATDRAQINHFRLGTVQFKTQPGFNLALDKATNPTTLVARQHHKIICIAHDLRLGPATRSVGRIKDLLKPYVFTGFAPFCNPLKLHDI